MSRWSLRDAEWKRVAAFVKERDGWQCVACQATEDLTVDHIESVKDLAAQDRLAQAYDPDYLLTMCRSCNSSKGDRADVRPTIVSGRWADVLNLAATIPL